jgi:hypothetical protein
MESYRTGRCLCESIVLKGSGNLKIRESVNTNKSQVKLCFACDLSFIALMQIQIYRKTRKRKGIYG